MRKSKRSKKQVQIDRSATTDVVTQLEVAIRHPHATLIGALVGAVVPWFARTLAHDELPTAWSAGRHTLAMIMLVVILGCACFSALTVYKFGRATFGDTRKACGFVLATEGAMLVSHGITSTVALAVLIVINALANGSAIALARDATCRRREADGRRVASRLRNRATKYDTTARSHIPVVEGVPAETSSRRHRAPSYTTALARRRNRQDDAIDAEIVS
jgi:hypothetical protein